MGNAVSRTWTWRFDAPVDLVWTALADTARFNEAAAFPKHRIQDQPQQDGSVIYTGHAKIGPFRVDWRELPVDWVANQRFRHARLFEHGPLRSLAATLALYPEGSAEGSGCRADYTIEVEPANLLGRLILATGFLARVGRTASRLAGETAAWAAARAEQPFRFPPAALTAEARARLASLLNRLIEMGRDPALVRRLGAFIIEAPEVDLLHLRPRRLAGMWRVAERDVIELCLWAAKLGLLEMRWELLCPNCRGPKLAVASLDRLPVGAHCNTCNIDYGRDFARNVEITFRPSSAIRRIEDGEFCLFGPMTTPHVVVQQTLAPGETRELPARLAPGDYRLRGLHPGGEALIRWDGGGFPELVVEADGVRAGPPSSEGAAAEGIVRLVNRSSREVTVVIESREWVRDALTAHRATTLQTFRELFSDEVLRAGDEVGVRHVTLIFTDLRGSTALYERIGDAAAYRLVRSHFAYLAAAVRRHDGAIVKTIGDAVMAAFAEPADAFRAALDVQRNVARFNSEQAGAAGAIAIKLGLHGGSCIAVTLNGRLDYFGSTVNLAARLQDQSRGGDIVISQALAEDGGVKAAMDGVPVAAETATVKGMAHPVAILRITPEVGAEGVSA